MKRISPKRDAAPPRASRRRESVAAAVPAPEAPLTADAGAGAAGSADCRMVVLTGGPGAGKTAVLEIARRSLGARVAILPEAATILYGGGFWRRNSLPARKAAQRAIYHVQTEQERMVVEEREAAFVLCDRGTLDGLAYWPEEEASFWRELETSREAEFRKYYAVIHLRTPSAAQGYNYRNPLRIEDAVKAQAIDEHIVGVWAGHPNRHFIESTDDFLLKAHMALGLIRRFLPPHRGPVESPAAR